MTALNNGINCGERGISCSLQFRKDGSVHRTIIQPLGYCFLFIKVTLIVFHGIFPKGYGTENTPTTIRTSSPKAYFYLSSTFTSDIKIKFIRELPL